MVALIVPCFTICSIFLNNPTSPLLNLELHLFKMQLHNMLSPPLSKYLCWDVSGEGTSAELVQCVRSRVTQSLTSPAALQSRRTAAQPSSGRVLCRCRRRPRTPFTNTDTVSAAAQLSVPHRSNQNSVFLTDQPLAFCSKDFFFLFFYRKMPHSRANLSGAKLEQKNLLLL